MEEFAGLRPTGEFNRKSKVSKCKVSGFKVEDLGVSRRARRLGGEKLRHGNGCGQLRRLTYNLADAFYHGEIERVVGAVATSVTMSTGSNAGASRLGHSGAELDGASWPGKRTSASSRLNFSTASSASFSPVSPSTSDRRGFIAEGQIVGADICRNHLPDVLQAAATAGSP